MRKKRFLLSEIYVCHNLIKKKVSEKPFNCQPASKLYTKKNILALAPTENVYRRSTKLHTL